MRPFVASLGLTALLLSGCGSDSEGGNEATPEDPLMALKAASDNLKDYQAVEMNVSLIGDADDWRELSDGDASVDENIDMILNSSVVIRGDVGEDKESPDDDLYSIGVVVDGVDAINMAGDVEIIYVQVAFDELSEKFPDIASTVDELRSGVESTPELSTLEPMLDGDWVGIEIGPDSALGQMLAESGMSTTTSTPSAEDMKAIEDAFTDVINGADVTRDKDDEDHIIATINAKEAYEKLQPILGEQGAAVSGLTGESLPDASEVPDQDITLDMWVKDNKLERIEVDLAQFKEGAASGAGIRVDISEIDGVELPTDAPLADLSMLLGSM